MNKSPLTTVLLAVLTVSALASVILCCLFIYRAREFRQLQGQVTINQNTRNMVNALANEALEYSKQHPDIDPVLVSVGVKPGAKPAQAPAPAATKPATK